MQVIDISNNIFNIAKEIYDLVYDNKKYLISDDNKNDYNLYYYFDNFPLIEGVISKHEKSGKYRISACVNYINDNDQEEFFSKIRIDDLFGSLRVAGSKTKDYLESDLGDSDFLKRNDSDLMLALISLEKYLNEMLKNYKNNLKSALELYYASFLDEE